MTRSRTARRSTTRSVPCRVARRLVPCRVHVRLIFAQDFPDAEQRRRILHITNLQAVCTRSEVSPDLQQRAPVGYVQEDVNDAHLSEMAQLPVE